MKSERTVEEEVTGAVVIVVVVVIFFFSSRRRHTRSLCDWEFRRVLFRSSPVGFPFRDTDVSLCTRPLFSHRPGGWLGIGGASLEVDGDHKAAGSLTSATGPQGRLCLASDR